MLKYILLKYNNNCIKSYTYVLMIFFKLITNSANNFFIEQFFILWLFYQIYNYKYIQNIFFTVKFV